jgi:hypothetical protein
MNYQREFIEIQGSEDCFGRCLWALGRTISSTFVPQNIKNKDCLLNALKCFNWYKGKNSKNLSLIDKETGACYDGINENGLNLNEGSESIISYGMAVMKISAIHY